MSKVQSGSIIVAGRGQRRTNRAIKTVVLLAASSAVASAQAQSLSWDGDGQLPVNGGSGVWNNTTPRWYDGASFVNWPNTTSAIANFGPFGGIVQVGEAVNAGGLTFGADYRLVNPGTSAAAITLGTGGTIDSGANRVEIINGLVQTGFTKVGSGTVLFHGSVGAGNININQGTIGAGTSNFDLLNTSLVTIAAGAALDFAATGGAVNDGFGGIAGAGNVILGTNVGLGVNTGSSITTGNNNGNDVYSGTISGGGRYTKVGTGTVTFSGNNTYTGTTSVQAGTLRLENGSALSNQSAVFLSNVAGVTLVVASNETIGSLGGGGATGGVVDIGANTLTIGADNTYNGFGGNFLGTGTVVKTGTGIAAIQNTTPVSTFAGKYRIEGGILSFTADARIGAVPAAPVADAITLAGGTLGNSTAGGTVVNANRGISVVADSGIYVTGTTASNFLFSGSFSGSGSITKTGLGNLRADGNNSGYSGTWIVRDGTLATAGIANVTPLGTGSIDVEGSTVSLIPATGGGDVVANLASGAGKTFSYGTGSILNLAKGTNTSLTVNLGDAAGTSSGLVRKANGTLVILAASGFVNLGTAGNERVFVNGGVTTVNGIVPGVFASTSSAATGGELLGYSAVNGLVPATYSSTDLSTATATDVVNQATAKTLVGPANAYALKLGSVVLNTGGNTVNIGDGNDAMLIVNTVGSITGGGSVNFGTARGTVYTQGAAGTINTTLTGSNGLTKVGAGPLTLGTAAGYTGPTEITQGSIALTGNDQLPTGTALTLRNSGALNLAGFQQTVASLSGPNNTSSIVTGTNGKLTVGSGDTTYLGSINPALAAGTATGTLVKNGTGTLTLGVPNSQTSNDSRTNFYSKLAVTGGGVVSISTNASLPVASQSSGVVVPDSITLDNGTLRITSVNSAGIGSGTASTFTLAASNTSLRGITVGAGGGTIDVTDPKEIVFLQRANDEVVANNSPLLYGSGTLTKTGPGFLRLGFGNDTFTGKIVVAGGNIQFQTDSTFGAAPASFVADQLTLNGGMIQTNGTGVIAANRGITVGANGGTLNAGITVNSQFTGSGPLSKITISVLTLNGSSPNYNGNFTIFAGRADANASTAFGTGTVTVTPQLQGGIGKTGGTADSVLNNPIVLNSGSAIDVRVDGTVGNLVLAGPVSGANGFYKSGTATAGVGQGTLVLSGNNSYAGPTVILTGTVQAASNNALGSTAAGTTVFPNATLAVNGGITTPAEAIGIAGTGVGGLGAIQNVAGNNVLGGAVTLMTDATIGVAADSLRVGSIAGNSTLTKIGGNTLTSGNYRTAGLAINAGTAAVAANGTTTGTSKVNALTIAGGAFDIADNALIVDYTGASPLATLTAQIASGRAGGLWNGAGINSSIAAGLSTRAVGIGEASVLGSPATFQGLSIDDTSILIRLTVLGDANLSGAVDFDDLLSLAQNYDPAATNKVWTQGDFNYDSVVNFDDLLSLAQNYGTSLSVEQSAIVGGSFAADYALALSQVPEPTSLGLLMGMAGLASRRRRLRK